MSNQHILSDHDLLEAFRTGNRKAFTIIYDRYWLLLYQHARYMLHDEEEAKDVVQEVFTSLWEKVGEINADMPLPAFLYTVTRNRILNILKHLKIEAKYLEQLQHLHNGSVDMSDAIIRERELAKIIEDGISKLPVKMREVFELSRKSHKSYKEISVQLNISDKTVKKQISNALCILRVKLNHFLMLF